MRWALSLFLGGLTVIASAAPALADPPGPTDYQSSIASMVPAMPGVHATMIGGDAFLQLEVEPGIHVVVLGYRAEPYVQFRPDGTVEQNRLTPTTYLNEDRYAETTIPAEASYDAEPEWEVVATNGRWAWHDHRTHWMNPQPPPGRGPGDRVAEGVIPVLIDGAEVDVTVASTWVEPPSRVPVFVGFAAGLGLAVIVWLRRRVLGALLGLSLLAAATGTIAYFSVPAETGPAWSLWALPVTAAGLTMTVAALGDRVPLIRRRGPILLLLAALELVAWGIVHWGWLWAAILPTSLPYWLDRLVAAGVLVGALGAAATLVALAGSERHVPTG